MAEIKEITSLSEYYETIKRDQYTIFDFHVLWFGACRDIAPVYERLAHEVAATVDCYRVDIDKAKEIWNEVGGTTMPTFVLYRKGNEVDRVSGGNADALAELFGRAAS